MGRQKERSDIGAKKGKGKNKMAVKKSLEVAQSVSKRALGGKNPIDKKSTSRSRKRFAARELKKAQEIANKKKKMEEKEENSEESDVEMPDDNVIFDSDEEEKPSGKKMKLFDEEDDEDGNLDESDNEADEEESDSDESVTTKSKKILARDAANRERAEKEWAADLGQKIKEEEGSEDEGLGDSPEEDARDFKALKARISYRLKILTKSKDVKKTKEESRTDIIAKLLADLETYYSYNSFLIFELFKLFTATHILDFLEASESPRPVTIRTNTLKTRRKDLAQALINKGVNLDPLGDWTKVGLVVYQSQVPIGATPEYLAGHYMIQGASSMLPVIALAPKENEKVLDLCAAPGMKTTYIAQLMRNTGTLVANDPNVERVKAVVGNTHRAGITNCVVSTLDGRKMSRFYHADFDRVLVDAPCSGTGVISKDPSVKASKDQINIQRCFTAQRELLLAAIDSCSWQSPTGGYIVYSTCSVLVDENECVVQYALDHRNVKIVPTGIQIGENGFTKFQHHRFNPSMNLCKRFYPHTHNMDGFFVCKLKKLPPPVTVNTDTDVKSEPDDDSE